MSTSSAIINFEIPAVMGEEVTEEQRNRQEFILGLVALAKFFNDHPELRIPHQQDIAVYVMNSWGAKIENPKGELAKFARAMGKCEKISTDSYFWIKKTFGRTGLIAMAEREQVCERVVVGTEHVPEHVEPAKAERVIPAHDVEKVEWRCSSILNAGDREKLESETRSTEPLVLPAADPDDTDIPF